VTTKPSQPRGRATGPVRLDRLAKACLGPAVVRQGFGSAEILTAWPDIVGADLAVRTRPERIKWPRQAKEGGATLATLIIRAEGGDALEIQHMQHEILARLNGYLGWGAVGRLVVRQMAAPQGASGRIRSVGRANSAPESQEPGAGAALDAAGIEDPGLHEALSRLMRARAGEKDNLP
jgi:hypothetical protein